MTHQSQPNILFIMADQVVAALTGAYGHSVVKTPNLDRLVAEGVRFDSAYSANPVCAPSRACLMTGRHASNIGAWDNAALLPADQPTWAHYLSEAGYDTVLAGKMHFVGPDQLHGFDRRMNTDIYPADFNWTRPEWIANKETQGRDYEAIMAKRTRFNASNYTGEAVRTDVSHNPLTYDEETHFRAIEYLNARGNEPAPFALTVSYHHPHEPFWPPKRFWDMYEGEQIDIPELPDDLDDTYSMMDRWLNAYHGTRQYDLRNPDGLRRLRRAYYAQMTYMDEKIGELLDTLERRGLADNTVVVFTSDHGDMLGEKEMVQKRSFYEWSCRVPLIIRFPGGRHSGEICETPVSLVDLLPTFCDLADADPSEPHDGDSLLPIIEGDTADRHIFAQSHEIVGAPCIMVREGTYKYTYIHGQDPQLFELESDPGEWHNLAGKLEVRDIEERLRNHVLGSFDPDEIAEANLASLRRRRLILSVMKKQGRTWTHFPTFDATRGASDQHLP